MGETSRLVGCVEVCSEKGVGIVDGNAENGDGDDGGI